MNHISMKFKQLHIFTKPIHRQSQWFNDTWLLIIGIPLLGLGIPFFSILFSGLPFQVLLKCSLMSLLATLTFWLGCRFIIIKVNLFFSWEKNPFSHLLADLILIPAYTFIVILVLYSIEITSPPLFSRPFKWTFWDNFLFSMFISLLISLIHEGIYIFIQWKHALVRSESLEKENILSQFETLKNQVNPHFLFNSLNTLLSIIEEDKSQAIEYVEKVSDFFRSILQLRDKNIIPLFEELELIRNYAFLQQKRYGDNLQVLINIAPEYYQSGIAPLTLQMLVENSVKHNVISTEKPLVIEVTVRDTDYIIVRNNLQKRQENETRSGLGLENIRKRYKYLSSEEVEIIITPLNFTVAIPILHTL